MSFVQEAMGDADCILFMTDIFEKEFPSPTVRRRGQCFLSRHMRCHEYRGKEVLVGARPRGVFYSLFPITHNSGSTPWLNP